MHVTAELTEQIAREAARAGALHRYARDLLVDVTHRAAAAGMSQREIARVVRRSQPEVSRLLRQRAPGPLALRISQQRQGVLEVMEKYGVTDARVFGSVATRLERPGSDIDLLIETREVLSLGALSRLERELSAVLDAKVDVVPSQHLPGFARERVLAESVPL